MVLIIQPINALAPAPCELRLESGRTIRYVAPKAANPRRETLGLQEAEFPLPGRKRSFSERLTLEDWEGVNCLTHTLDVIVEVEYEVDLFNGKKVLEIGFSTGLPSVYAWENGASELAIHHGSKTDLELYTLPTLKRNNIPLNKVKTSHGDLTELKKAIGGQKFDVILGADLLNRNSEEFEQLHDIIDEALSEEGICIFSAQSYYQHVDGCLSNFLSVVKRNRRLDDLERWSSPRTDVIQRKVIQLTKSFF